MLMATSTTLCLLHRAHMPPATSSNGASNGNPDDTAYPSRNIAFTAASMITSIIENLQSHDQIRYCPAFIVYSLFSALIMHVYQMRSNVPSVVAATQVRMQICMNGLKEVSKVWLVATMVHTLFESILGNKALEERLQKAAGRRHKKHTNHHVHAPVPKREREEMPKRKYDDMDLGGFSSGPPAPQVSYERSRPQTPAVTPSRELAQPVNNMSAPTITSPHMRNAQGDTFMGNSGSRGNTRPPTPFNPSMSVPATPPDLYLVTRSSPPISQSLWENFQPDQLFPEGNLAGYGQQFSPTHLDAQLAQGMPVGLGQGSPGMQGIQMTGQPGQQRGSMGTMGGQRRQQGAGSPNTINMQGVQQGVHGIQLQNGPQGNMGWSGMSQFDEGVAASSPDDTWSNSSKGGAPVPTTLNVEDWYAFFGASALIGGGGGEGDLGGGQG
jgi:hypothetical protein